jgi:uncharacterized membrane protein YtjA (UPF0391 family)
MPVQTDTNGRFLGVASVIGPPLAVRPSGQGKLFPNQERQMLKWALIFFVVSLVAGLFGFTGIAVGAAEISKILFFVFLVLFAIFLVAGLLAVNKLRE